MSNEWISVNDRLPAPNDRVLSTCGANVVIGYLDTNGCWREYDGRVSWQPTFWRPLPEPPKRQSSFDKWWFHHQPSIVHGTVRIAAETIWQAAIAASKQPDYVP